MDGDWGHDRSLIYVDSVNGARVELRVGDLARQKVDAIVNAADSRLSGGGGVCAAIHRAGGPSIMEECRRIGGCPVGEAVVTTAGTLNARYVIHTVGPSWEGGDHNEAALLSSAYAQSLRRAMELGCQSVAFPAIGTGAFGYPVERAARVAMTTLDGLLSSRETGIGLVRMMFISPADAEVYRAAAVDVSERRFFGCWRNFHQQPGHLYLELLNLSNVRADSQHAVLLRDISSHPDWVEDSLRLLADLNWRSHLAPAISEAVSQSRPPELMSALWAAVKRGSWVAPQLLCVLSQSDSGFVDGATDVLAHWSEAAISGERRDDRLCKIASALRGLAEMGAWKVPDGLHLQIEGLANDDSQGGDSIARDWLPRLMALIEGLKSPGPPNPI